MGFKSIFKRFKDTFLSEELNLAEAKMLAMLAVIYSDDKEDMEREMGLLQALCSFDERLVGVEIESYIERFKKYDGNLNYLFEKLAESILEREARMDLMSSAYLLASIDGNVSKEEMQILNRLGNTLRMTLEEINTVKEHSQYIAQTMNIQHLVGETGEQTALSKLSLPEATIFAMLAVIHSDNKKDMEREMGLLQALCSFDKRLAEVDIAATKKRFEEYQHDQNLFFEVLANAVIESGDRMDVLSSAFLLAGIDGNITEEESQMLDRLATTLHMTTEELQMVKKNSEALVETMKELRVLA